VNGAGSDNDDQAVVCPIEDVDDLSTCFEDSARSVLCDGHLLLKENWRKNESAGFDPEVICGI
jgi:hypothetical protein